MITVKGTLSSPLGESIAGATIRFTPIKNGVVLVFISGEQVTSTTGQYSFSLNEGTYRVEVKVNDKYSDTAIIELTTDTGTITIEDLIKTYKISDQ